MERVILVTGASSDVGLELIKRIAPQYDLILGHYCHMSDALLRLKQELGEKLQLFQADFLNSSEVDKMIHDIDDKGHIPLHIVHLPAAKAVNQRFHKIVEEDFLESIEISIISIIKILKHYIPKMNKEKYGKIVFMLTAYTLNIPPKYQSAYVTTKYALLGLLKSLSVEYADKGITVNGVSPNMIDTKFLSDLPDIVIQQNASKTARGRNLEVEDVVPVFEYLLSKDADSITGQNIEINS